MTSLALPEGVHFCIAQAHGVFLDLNDDAYHAIPLEGGAGSSEIEAGRLEAALNAHSRQLREAGLLTDRTSLTRSLDAYRSIRSPGDVAPPDLDRRAFGGAANLTPVDVFDVGVACRRADVLLRRNHISRVVGRVRARKPLERVATTSTNTLRRQVKIFGALRPWYPRDYLCLFDSLALLEFLARRDVFPDWVFGVQVQPFAAHCWVQEDGILLNETYEYASQFTPIMSI